MKAIIIIAITAVICLGGIMFRGRKDQKEKERRVGKIHRTVWRFRFIPD